MRLKPSLSPARCLLPQQRPVMSMIGRPPRLATSARNPTCSRQLPWPVAPPRTPIGPDEEADQSTRAPTTRSRPSQEKDSQNETASWKSHGYSLCTGWANRPACPWPLVQPSGHCKSNRNQPIKPTNVPRRRFFPCRSRTVKPRPPTRPSLTPPPTPTYTHSRTRILAFRTSTLRFSLTNELATALLREHASALRGV